MGNVVKEGKTICENLTSMNKGDYLTKKVVTETMDVLDEIEDLEREINNVASKVEWKRQEIIERERRRREEQERLEKEKKEKEEQEKKEQESKTE